MQGNRHCQGVINYYSASRNWALPAPQLARNEGAGKRENAGRDGGVCVTCDVKQLVHDTALRSTFLS